MTLVYGLTTVVDVVFFAIVWGHDADGNEDCNLDDDDEVAGWCAADCDDGDRMPMTLTPHGGVPDPDSVPTSIADTDIPALNAITESGDCINGVAFVDGTTRGRRWGWKSPACPCIV